MTDQFSSVVLDVPNSYQLTARQRIHVESKILEWDSSKYPLLERNLTVAGETLFQEVVHQSYMGPLPLDVWLFGQGAIQIFRFEEPPTHVTIGALSALPGVEQLAVLGQIVKQERGARHSMAHAYVEDQQGRWWFGAQALDESGMVVFDEPAVSELQTDGKPIGVGGWFAMSRRLGLMGFLSSME